MVNNTINIEALTEEFKVECTIIKLDYEYPGYTGTEKYAIVTDLNYAQIMERYAPVAEHYCPFLLLSKAAGEVIADFKRNEDKFSKRMQKDDCYGFEDGMTERYNIECCVPDFTEALFQECFPQQLVEKAFSLLRLVGVIKHILLIFIGSLSLMQFEIGADRLSQNSMPKIFLSA